MKLDILLKKEIHKTHGNTMEKTAYDIGEIAGADAVYHYILKAARENPLHSIEWNLEMHGKSASGTYSSGSDTDSKITLLEDINEAIASMRKK